MRLSSRILFDETQIAHRVDAMARAIVADTPDGVAVSVVALMDGAFMFCADLVRHMPMPVNLALVPIVSIDRGGEPDAIMLGPDFPVRGADVLVVEDILDTGRTLAAVTRRLERDQPSRVRVAVLLDKPARRAVSFEPAYRGFVIEDVWAVGYGLDYHGLYRNLPYISMVEGT
jgi:hypoxanthine phosphoribosyltransferase